MLQKLHEKTKGWVAAVIIGLLSVVFVLWGVEYYMNGLSSSGSVLAKVGHKKITERELSPVVRQLQQQVSASGTALTDSVMQQIKAIALQNIIAEIALSQAAVRSGFVVSLADAQRFVAAIPAFQDRGAFSSQRFSQYLYANGLSAQQFLAQLQNTLLVDQVAEGVQSTTFVLPSELSDFYRLFYQERSFQYLLISGQSFRNKVSVTPELMQRYYDNNKESLRMPQQVSVDYLELSPSLAVKQGDRLADLVFTNPDSLQVAAKTLNLPIKSSALFTQAGTKTGVSASPLVVAAAFSPDVLQQKNNSHTLSLSDGRMVVLRVKHYLPSRVPPFHLVQAKIRQQLIQQLSQAQAALLATQWQQAIEQGTLVDLLAQKNQASWVQKTSRRQGDTQTPEAVLAAVFNLSLEKPHPVTTVGLPNGDSALIYLRSIKNPDFNQLSAEQRQLFSQKMQKMFADMMYQFYMLSVQKSLPTKIYSTQ